MKIHKFEHTENPIKGHNGILYEILPKQKNGFKYRLLEDYHFDTGVKIKKAIVHGFISLMTTGRMHLKVGFEWDGATKFLDMIFIMRPSAEHDPFCELIVRGLLDIKHLTIANNRFKTECLKDGIKNIDLEEDNNKLERYLKIKCLKIMINTARAGLFLFSRLHIKKCIKKQVKKTETVTTSGTEVK